MSFSLQVIDKCFVGTASRLSGVTFAVLAQEVCTYSTLSDLHDCVVVLMWVALLNEF